MASGRQSGAALGAARLQNQAATFGGHTGAKAMGTLAMDDAGLESPLHGDSLMGRGTKTKQVFGF